MPALVLRMFAVNRGPNPTECRAQTNLMDSQILVVEVQERLVPALVLRLDFRVLQVTAAETRKQPTPCS